MSWSWQDPASPLAGASDISFGGKGSIGTGLNAALAGVARGVAIDNAGRIAVAGTTAAGDAIMVRYLTGGNLDQGFAGDGIAHIDLGSSADAVHELALMSDGSLLAVGETDNGTDADLALVRAHGDADGGVVYVLHDANFNVTSLIGDSGTDWEVIERFVYDPYGERTVLNADWTVDTDGLSDVAFVHGHQGGRHDLAVGLVDFRNRFLDTSLGRWTRQDPLGYVDGPNSYTAFRAASVRRVDPYGLQSTAPSSPIRPVTPAEVAAELAGLDNWPEIKTSIEEIGLNPNNLGDGGILTGIGKSAGAFRIVRVQCPDGTKLVQRIVRGSYVEDQQGRHDLGSSELIIEEIADGRLDPIMVARGVSEIENLFRQGARKYCMTLSWIGVCANRCKDEVIGKPDVSTKDGVRGWYPPNPSFPDVVDWPQGVDAAYSWQQTVCFTKKADGTLAVDVTVTDPKLPPGQ